MTIYNKKEIVSIIAYNCVFQCGHHNRLVVIAQENKTIENGTIEIVLGDDY
jgi:hypothetical protein